MFPIDDVPILFLCRVMVSEVQEFQFRVEMWDDRDTKVEDVIALVRDHAVARAGFRGSGATAAGQDYHSSAEIESARR